MRELISYEEIAQMIPFFKGKESLVRFIKKTFRLSRVEDIVWRYSSLTGLDFTEAVFDELGVDLQVGGVPLESLPKGAFFTIHNHPYGGLDGCALVNLFSRLDPQYKLMVNKILYRIWPLEENFITVIPTGEHKTAPKAESLVGVRETIAQIRSGHPMGIFPSGAVSDLSLKDRCVRDRPWQEGAIRIIAKMKVPVVPVRFFDGNSAFYYSLGLLSWKVRLLRLPSEVFNKRGKPMRIGIGPVITPEVISSFGDTESLTGFLRDSVYGMKLPSSFVPRSELPKSFSYGQDTEFHD